MTILDTIWADCYSLPFGSDFLPGVVSSASHSVLATTPSRVNFGATATPSVVAENAITRRHNVLVGDKQINLQVIDSVLAEVSS
jgi:hypothetical protein